MSKGKRREKGEAQAHIDVTSDPPSTSCPPLPALSNPTLTAPLALFLPHSSSGLHLLLILLWPTHNCTGGLVALAGGTSLPMVSSCFLWQNEWMRLAYSSVYQVLLHGSMADYHLSCTVHTFIFGETDLGIMRMTLIEKIISCDPIIKKQICTDLWSMGDFISNNNNNSVLILFFRHEATEVCNSKINCTMK